ncbi:MAG TPA: phenylalanine--tRNA ligase subunit beta [Candidatus Bilamarchaeum sp.]|nr:phenylalanine--tRNA ligase subunit beta [Candidatus Bilamarchaeum sp.]
MVDMVVVEFAYEEMRRLIDLPRDKMIATLSELGAPSEYEPEVKKIITELTPNRPDWYSMEGLARALRAYHRDERPEYSAKKSAYKVSVDASVAKIRPYTVCAVVKGLKFDDQRIRDAVLLQEKLLGTLGRKVKRFGLGIYPLSAIKFPVRYTTLKPEEIRYVPLGHDREMSAKEILEEHKKGQQYGHLIRGHPRFPVFVDAENRIMALIPVVNSAETGKIDESTTEIFIEVSGMDIHSCKAALNILVCTFADMGGQVYEVMMEYGADKFASPDLGTKKMKLDAKEVERVLGVKLPERDIKALLAKMGYEYSHGIVHIPPYRADVMSQVDVIEDIAIAYGYNNFIPTLPDFFNPGETIKKYDRADGIMRGMGFVENTTFILTNKESLAKIGFGGKAVEISNPSTVEYTVVRPNLIVSMLESFSTNKMKGLPQKFYEIGIVHDGTQKKRLVFGMMDRKVEFSDFRGVLQTLAFESGFGFQLRKAANAAFNAEISAGVVSDGKNIGILGKVSPEVLEKFGIAFDVYICELELW